MVLIGAGVVTVVAIIAVLNANTGLRRTLIGMWGLYLAYTMGLTVQHLYVAIGAAMDLL